MTRTKPAGQRRADLLAAGQTLFLDKGIAATSLEDITHRAGVSKGLFYLYFHSKENLVLALQEQFSCQFAERICAATARQPDWTAKLDACVQAIFDCYTERQELHEVLFHHGGHVTPDHQPVHAAVLRAIEGLLADGAAAGAYRVEDPAATAVLCWASMHAFDSDFRGASGPSDARLIRAAQRLFRRAVGGLG